MADNRWDAEDVRAAVDVLGQSESVKAAAAELSKRFQRKITGNTLRHVFSSRYLEAPHTYLKRPPPDEAGGLSSFPKPPAADPLEEHERKSERSRLKRENKDLLERLQIAEARQDVLSEMQDAPAPEPISRRERGSKVRECTAVALASDWHVEEVVKPQSVSGRNEYCLTIARRRVARFFEGIRWCTDNHRASKQFVIRDLILGFLGDLMSGHIHEELAETNGLTPIETVLALQDWVRAELDGLLELGGFERIIIPWVPGNHGRTTKKIRRATGAQNSYEWLLGSTLARHYASEPRISFVISQSLHQYYEAYGQTLHFTHGDEVRYSGGIGGIWIPLNKRTPQWETVRRADLHHLGHFHRQSLDHDNTVLNGSLIGYNAYALSIGAPYAPPLQAYYLLDSRRGKCMATPLWVDGE
jgi:hypothetical protein